jgi:hypothetical protein
MKDKLYSIGFYDKNNGSLCFQISKKYKAKRNAQKRLDIMIGNCYHYAYDIRIDEEIAKKYFVDIYKDGTLILRVAEIFTDLQKAEKKVKALKKDYGEQVEIKITEGE